MLLNSGRFGTCSCICTRRSLSGSCLIGRLVGHPVLYLLAIGTSQLRGIFDQCVSGPSSGQSSGISSPAHTKSISSRTRRQPSIISSAFCSSKKLSLQPFHIMTSVSESGKTKNAFKTKIKHEPFSSETLDIHPLSFPPDPGSCLIQEVVLWPIP